MKFTAAHIVSVVHDRMLVSGPELKRFLEFLCGKKLKDIHLAAASDFCKIPLFQQFPWVDKLNTKSLDLEIHRINSEVQLTVEALNLTTDPTQKDHSVAHTIAGQAVGREKLDAARDKWLETVVHKKAKGSEFEVLSLAEMDHPPFNKAYFNYWWLNERA